jgi:amino acid permease
VEGGERQPLLKHNEDEGVLPKGSVLAASVCLCKAAIGAGVLSIAARCAEVGFTFMLVALAVGGALTVVSIRMIGEASIATGLWSFEDICDELFHPSLSIVTGLIQSSNCLGAAAAYLIICGQIFQVLTGAGDELFAPFVVACGIFICLPMALARHVNFLRYVSVLSVAGLVFLVGSVAYILLRYGRDDTVNTRAISHGDGRANLFVQMNCLNLVVFAFNNQFNVPQLTGELRPLGKEQVSKMANLSTVFVFILYVTVALLGLLAFGVGDRQLETLVLDVRPHAGSPVVGAALVMVMFSTLMCFEFHIYPIRQFLAYTVRKVRGRPAGDEDSDEKIWSISVTRWLDVVCAVGAVAISIIIAVSLKRVKIILDFVGAFAGAYTSYVVPPLWILRLRCQHSFDASCATSYESASLCWAVLAIGAFFFFFGTYAAIAA